jgi:hypothetical protein
MQQSPLKDKDLGVQISGSHDEVKFADVRQRAKEEYIQRKAKHKKDKTIPVPEAYPGKQVVVTYERYKSNKQYHLFEVIDFKKLWSDQFTYFGVLLKTTDKESLDKIGRLDTFCGLEQHWSFDKKLSKLTEDKIKWLNR